MTWAKFDDGFYTHPKLASLGFYQLPCVGLHLLAITWSNATLTDGHIPRSQIFKLAGDIEMLVPSGKPWELVHPLVSSGMWDECDEHDDPAAKGPLCYVIHDFHVYNPSREEVLRDREALHEARAAAGKAGGVRSGEIRRSKHEANGEANTKQTTNQTRSPVPVPVKSIEVTESPNGDSSTRHEPSATGMVFDAWLATLPERTQRQLTTGRERTIRQRLRRFPLVDVMDAVRGWPNDPWEDRFSHNDLVILLRSDETCEKFRDLYRNGKPMPGRQHAQASELDAWLRNSGEQPIRVLGVGP